MLVNAAAFYMGWARNCAAQSRNCAAQRTACANLAFPVHNAARWHSLCRLEEPGPSQARPGRPHSPWGPGLRAMQSGSAAVAQCLPPPSGAACCAPSTKRACRGAKPNHNPTLTCCARASQARSGTVYAPGLNYAPQPLPARTPPRPSEEGAAPVSALSYGSPVRRPRRPGGARPRLEEPRKPLCAAATCMRSLS